MFSLRVDLYEEGGFKEYQAGLEQAGKWRLAELSEPFYPLPKGEPDVVHRMLGLPGHRVTAFLADSGDRAGASSRLTAPCAVVDTTSGLSAGVPTVWNGF